MLGKCHLNLILSCLSYIQFWYTLFNVLISRLKIPFLLAQSITHAKLNSYLQGSGFSVIGASVGSGVAETKFISLTLTYHKLIWNVYR